MMTVSAYLLLFGAFVALIGASLLLEPEDDSGATAYAPVATQAAVTATAVIEPASTPTPSRGLNDERPDSYTWVLLLSIAPPGEALPTLITKRSGAYVAPDRRQEAAGGAGAGGEAWDKFVTVIGNNVWERRGGPGPAWNAVEDASPALANAGDPPYWHLFEVRDGALAGVTPDHLRDEFDGTSALLYRLTLSDLPGLHDYFVASINDALPEAEVEALSAVPVNYWLRASDTRPLRIQVFPPEQVAPETQLSFNIFLMNLDSPVVVIEVPDTTTTP